MILGYNTNGFAHHDPLEALQLLADIGFRSVAITVDHKWLSPNDPNHKTQLQEIKAFLIQHGFESAIETGARFLLDPTKKHWPTLVDPNDSAVARRIDFLKHCVDLAAELDSQCVSIWSGQKPPEMTFQQALDRLAKNLETVVAYADRQAVDIGFEPEPGMLVDTTGRFERLLHLFDSPRLKMTMDVGHLFCMSEVPIVDYIERWKDRLVNVHIEDMKAGVHEHLMFGEGQIRFPPVIKSLTEIAYDKGLHVELSRHSHNAPEIALRSFEFLNPLIKETRAQMDLLP